MRAPFFLGSLTCQRAPAAHRSFAASYLTHKNILNLSNLGRFVKGFFLSTGPQRLWNMRSPAPPPAPPIAASLILLRQYFGVKFWTNATRRPNFFRFSLLCIAFGSVLFVILFLFVSPFPFLLILLFVSFSSYLFLFFSYRCYSSSSYSSFFNPFGVKFMYQCDHSS